MQSHPDRAAQDLVQVACGYLHGWRLHSRTYPGTKVKKLKALRRFGPPEVPAGVHTQLGSYLFHCSPAFTRIQTTHIHDLWTMAPLQVTTELFNNNSIRLQLCVSLPPTSGFSPLWSSRGTEQCCEYLPVPCRRAPHSTLPSALCRGC